MKINFGTFSSFSGVSNIASCFVSSYPVTGSFSRYKQLPITPGYKTFFMLNSMESLKFNFSFMSKYPELKDFFAALNSQSPQPRSDANFCFTRGDFSRLSE